MRSSTPLMLLQLPAVWQSLRRARRRLRHSLAMALQLDVLSARAGASRPMDQGQAQRLAATVYALGRRMRGYNCLPQSIALANLLRRRGVNASVVLGAHKQSGSFSAHAWVESALGNFDPQPQSLTAFTPLERFPREGQRP